MWTWFPMCLCHKRHPQGTLPAEWPKFRDGSLSNIKKPFGMMKSASTVKRKAYMPTTCTSHKCQWQNNDKHLAAESLGEIVGQREVRKEIVAAQNDQWITTTTATTTAAATTTSSWQTHDSIFQNHHIMPMPCHVLSYLPTPPLCTAPTTGNTWSSSPNFCSASKEVAIFTSKMPGPAWNNLVISWYMPADICNKMQAKDICILHEAMNAFMHVQFQLFHFHCLHAFAKSKKKREVILHFQGKVSAALTSWLPLQSCLKPVCDKYSADTEQGTSLQRTQTFSLGLHSTSQV